MNECMFRGRIEITCTKIFFQLLKTMFAHSLHDENQGCKTFHNSLLSPLIILLRSNAHFVSGDLFYLCRRPSRHRTSELRFQHVVLLTLSTCCI